MKCEVQEQLHILLFSLTVAACYSVVHHAAAVVSVLSVLVCSEPLDFGWGLMILGSVHIRSDCSFLIGSLFSSLLIYTLWF